jgi:hypothetical protein
MTQFYPFPISVVVVVVIPSQYAMCTGSKQRRRMPILFKSGAELPLQESQGITLK